MTKFLALHSTSFYLIGANVARFCMAHFVLPRGLELSQINIFFNFFPVLKNGPASHFSLISLLEHGALYKIDSHSRVCLTLLSKFLYLEPHQIFLWDHPDILGFECWSFWHPVGIVKVLILCGGEYLVAIWAFQAILCNKDQNKLGQAKMCKIRSYYLSKMRYCAEPEIFCDYFCWTKIVVYSLHSSETCVVTE